MVPPVTQVELVPTVKMDLAPAMSLQTVDREKLVPQVARVHEVSQVQPVQTDPLAVQLVSQVAEVFQAQTELTVTQVKMVSQANEVLRVSEVLPVKKVFQAQLVLQVTQA
jgi:O-methyltransferase involved in polyketide biosynthesis